MYYQTLLTLNKKYEKDIIEQYDKWLYTLPKGESDRISIGKVSNQLNIEFSLAKNLLEDSVKLNILDHCYAIKFPECGHIIEIVPIEELYDKINIINNCDACEIEDIIITDEDIQILYKKIDNDEVMNEKSDMRDIIEYTSSDTLKGFIDDEIIKPNDIFFKPTQEQRDKMIELFDKIGEKANNTTALGNQLRDFTEYVLRIVKIFEAANVRTKTNELDCLVKNKLHFASPYFINELGSLIIVECKNEKSKPNNTYFHKVQGNLKLYKSNCGIIIAINDPTKAAIQVANSNYLRDNTIIVSINYQELEKIVYDNLNFLDLLENKVVMLKTNATTYLGDNKVFEQSK